MKVFKDKKKEIVPESSKILKARQKLQEEWARLDVLITPSALAATIEKIHSRIAQNSMHRVSLRKKEIRLFDQNKNAAALSRKVQILAKRIAQNISSDS
jgi:hypothetical protein